MVDFWIEAWRWYRSLPCEEKVLLGKEAKGCRCREVEHSIELCILGYIAVMSLRIVEWAWSDKRYEVSTFKCVSFQYSVWYLVLGSLTHFCAMWSSQERSASAVALVVNSLRSTQKTQKNNWQASYSQLIILLSGSECIQLLQRTHIQFLAPVLDCPCLPVKTDSRDLTSLAFVGIGIHVHTQT